MKCLNCGKNVESFICLDCRTEKVLDKIFNEIFFFNEEKCENEFIKEYMKKFEKMQDARTDIPQIFELFEKEISEFYWLRYYKLMKDECFESKAIKFLENFDENDIKHMQNNYEKPLSWCEKIKASKKITPELQNVAAEFYSMIAEYDIAEDMLNIIEKNVNKEEFNNYMFSNKENILSEIEKRKNLLSRYRGGKPYWPNTEERRKLLIPIYEQKGIEYPRIELKPSKINENDFEGIIESDLEKLDNYCAFWCSGVQTPSRVFAICEIAAIKVRDNKIVDKFQKYIKPWDGESIAKRAGKKYGVPIEKLYAADDVDLVMKKFFEFVGDDTLISTDALSEQAKFIVRAARYSGMKKIKNSLFELLDYAADISEKFDLENNNRKYLLKYFRMSDGNNSLEKAKKNIDIYNKLKKMGE